MKLRAGVTTDKGRVRSFNEDAYVCRGDEGLFVVCDGMGGAAAGEIASQLAVETIRRQLGGESNGSDAASEASEEFLSRTRRLASAVRSSHQAIHDQAQRDSRYSGMGTTVVGAWIEDHVASLAHVGDSRAYLWHKRQFQPLTRDHSLVEAQVDAGLVTSEESLQAEEQNVLLRVLGREPTVEVELSEVPVEPGDYLLLCTDGLTRTVADPDMAEAIATVREPQRICDHLVDAANRSGGPDNITVLVVEIVGSWWPRWWNRWQARVLRRSTWPS